MIDKPAPSASRTTTTTDPNLIEPSFNATQANVANQI